MQQDITTIIDSLELLPINKIESFDSFSNEFEEYGTFLIEDARKYEILNISRTHLLIDTLNANILAYMTLVTDSVQLTKSEKEVLKLGLIPFSSFPALKIGKLAVDQAAKMKYNGIGTLMVRLARGFALNLNGNGIACRFLTIDADVEHNPNVTEFYTKCGFTPNEKLSNKKRLTISMRMDIFMSSD